MSSTVACAVARVSFRRFGDLTKLSQVEPVLRRYART